MSNTDQEPVTVTAELRNETERAYLIVDTDGKQAWLPKSRTEGRYIGNRVYEFTIPEWLAIEKGLV